MRIFLAGATGTIGIRLLPLLVRSGHTVTATTRIPAKAAALESVGAEPLVLDVFEAEAVRRAVIATRADIIINQLTDLPQRVHGPLDEAAAARNARIRIEGAANLLTAARAAGTPRLIAQSVGFMYAQPRTPHLETDALVSDEGNSPRAITARGVRALEEGTLTTAGISGIVLRYGRLYGPGTWSAQRQGRGSLHVDAAAHAALLAVTCGNAGIYNIAEDDGELAIGKARTELGFDPDFRWRC